MSTALNNIQPIQTTAKVMIRHPELINKGQHSDPFLVWGHHLSITSPRRGPSSTCLYQVPFQRTTVSTWRFPDPRFQAAPLSGALNYPSASDQFIKVKVLSEKVQCSSIFERKLGVLVLLDFNMGWCERVKITRETNIVNRRSGLRTLFKVGVNGSNGAPKFAIGNTLGDNRRATNTIKTVWLLLCLLTRYNPTAGAINRPSIYAGE